MPSEHEADELDRLIEAHRHGESWPAADPATDALADLASEIEDLAKQSTSPERDAVWSRVAAGIEAYERGQSRVPMLRLRRWHALPRAVWAPAIAAGVALFAIVFALISEPANTSAAFLRDVEELSSMATQALADDVLTEDERDAVAALTASLVTAIDRQPETLADLEPAEREAVLSQLEIVVSILLPAADDELVEARSNTLLAAAGFVAAPRAAGPAADRPGASLPDAVEVAGPPERDAAIPAAVLGAGAPPTAEGTPSVAVSVTSLLGVTDAVESAQRDGPPADAPGRDGGIGRGATNDDLRSLCFGLSGSGLASCERAVVAAVAACGALSAGHDFDACEEASEFAEDVCDDLLSKRDAKTCERALERLEEAAEHEAERHEDDGHSPLEYGNITPSNEDRDDRDGSEHDSDDD